MVVIDPSRELNAVREARKMGVVVIGLLDTDCDPSTVDIVIPGNDDALKSVRLLIEQLADSVEEGWHQHTDHLRSMGAAERRSEDTVPGDDVRPTTSNRLPERQMTPVGELPPETPLAPRPQGDA